MTIESAVSFQERFSPSVLSFREKEFQAVLVNVSIQGRRPLAASTFYFELLLFLSSLPFQSSSQDSPPSFYSVDGIEVLIDAILNSLLVSLSLSFSLWTQNRFTPSAVNARARFFLFPIADRNGATLFSSLAFSPKFRQFRGFNCHQTKFRKISFRGGDGIHFRDENFVELFRERRKDEIVE